MTCPVSTAKNGSRDLNFVQWRSQARPLSLWAKSMSSWSCNSCGAGGAGAPMEEYPLASGDCLAEQTWKEENENVG